MMKTFLYILPVLLFFLCGCENFPEPTPMPPTVITGDATEISRTRAVLSGSYIETSAVETVDWYEILLSEYESMDVITGITNIISVDGTVFSAEANFLKPGKVYYYQACVSNGYSTAYGEIKSFTTLNVAPPVFYELSLIGTAPGEAILRAELQDDGGAEITASGFCWEISDSLSMPTIDNEHKMVDYMEMHYYPLSGLLANTRYSIRAFATNSAGTGYSNSINFLTDERGMPIFDSSIFPWDEEEETPIPSLDQNNEYFFINAAFKCDARIVENPYNVTEPNTSWFQIQEFLDNGIYRVYIDEADPGWYGVVAEGDSIIGHALYYCLDNSKNFYAHDPYDGWTMQGQFPNEYWELINGEKESITYFEEDTDYDGDNSTGIIWEVTITYLNDFDIYHYYAGRNISFEERPMWEWPGFPTESRKVESTPRLKSLHCLKRK